MVLLNGFKGNWITQLVRFLILLSSIIPISLRVNLDMGKTLYSYLINADHEIPGSLVRTSSIPEELGRVEYLLSDKTGTLTKNGKLNFVFLISLEMELKKIHLGNILITQESFCEILPNIQAFFHVSRNLSLNSFTFLASSPLSPKLGRRNKAGLMTRVSEFALALSLCHNVCFS